MRIAGDLHCHSIASTHAYATVDELCLYAARRNLAFIAVTDHGPKLPDSPHLWHFSGLRRLPRIIRGVRLLSGCEANLLDSSGALDLPDYILGQLSFVIASLHTPTFEPASEKEHTAAWLAAAANPLVDCLGHLGQPQYPFDVGAVVEACAASGTLIEINSASFSIRKGSAETCRRVALACRERNVRICVTSDAHSAYDIGNFTDALLMLSDIGFPPELIVNSSVERFSAYFEARKNVDLFFREDMDSVYWD